MQARASKAGRTAFGAKKGPPAGGPGVEPEETQYLISLTRAATFSETLLGNEA